VSREASLGTLRRLAPLLPVACALFAWAPLLDNYFKGDDFVHLYDLATKPFLRLLVLPYAGHVYTVRNTVFDVMFRLFGTDPRPYFWSALLTHALNALLLYGAIRRFAGSVVLACFGATLWATSPVLEEALGWYSVYGQVLCTAIMLGVLWSLGGKLTTGAVVSTRTALGWAALLFAGSTCFGTALALARRQLPMRSALPVPRALGRHAPRLHGARAGGSPRRHRERGRSGDDRRVDGRPDRGARGAAVSHRPLGFGTR
jgi:hypothetical protein